MSFAKLRPDIHADGRPCTGYGLTVTEGSYSASG